MIRKKSKLEDEQIVRDESVDQVERASAALRLASDGFGKDLHPILDKWLDDPNFILRSEAINLLLGSWGFEKYLKKGVEMLQKDQRWEVKCAAASALKSFATNFDKGEKYKTTILKKLFESLLNDENKIVQKRVYEYIYNIITHKKIFIESYEFDEQRDINWNLLEPYLEKFNLQKPI